VLTTVGYAGYDQLTKSVTKPTCFGYTSVLKRNQKAAISLAAMLANEHDRRRHNRGEASLIGPIDGDLSGCKTYSS
jgi:hypothetical protein